MTGVGRPARGVVPRRSAHPFPAWVVLWGVSWGMVAIVTACVGDADSSGPEEEPTRAAGRLEAVAGCAGEGPNNHVADFTWEPAHPAGDAQQLVLSYLRGGLETDAFVQTPPLPGDRSSYHWVHLNPGTEPRYWRVLTRYGERWVPSETATFRGVDCPD